MDRPDFLIPFHLLPAGVAKRIDSPPEHPAKPRAAATVVLLRPGSRGLEVLLLRRHRSSGFVPGAYVFPGGTVDPEDGDPPLLRRVVGLNESDAAERLSLFSANPPALAYYLAAVREAFEETCLIVGSTVNELSGAGTSHRRQELRSQLLEGERTFDRILEDLGTAIDAGALEYIAHWITPEAEPRRYDTRFFAAEVPSDAPAVLDSREMTASLWLTPDEALARNRSGSLPMIFPTIRTLQDLQGFREPGQALAFFRERTIPTILPRLVRTPHGAGLVLGQEPPHPSQKETP